MNAKSRRRPNVAKMRNAMRRDRSYAASRSGEGAWGRFLREIWSCRRG